MNGDETIPGELTAIHERLDAGDKRMEGIESQVAENTRLTIENTTLTRDNAATTQEIKDLIVAAKLGFKVLGGLGVAFKWMGIIAAAAGSIYSAYLLFRNGGSKP